MKLFLGLLCAALAAAFTVTDAGPVEEPASYYHEAVGIAAAERIRLAEAKAEAESGSRIAGGSASALGNHPYMGGLVITLTLGATSVCGATLLSSTRLVTAAHCWWDGRFQATKFTVVLGSLQLFTGGERIDTDAVETHASWNPTTLTNDIAAIGLPSPVTLSSLISPASLPNGDHLSHLFVGWWAEAAGFGMTGDASSDAITTSQSLSAVSLQVITNAVCRRSHTQVGASNICASGEFAGRGACTGDSGGPLVYTDGIKPMLIGIASFGWSQGCTLGNPVAFARVTEFNTWIRLRM